MNSIETWTAFFGWLSVIHLGLYLIVVFFVTLLGDFSVRMNAKMFKVPEDRVRELSFQYVANYKLGLAFFAIVPYIALRLMA